MRSKGSLLTVMALLIALIFSVMTLPAGAKDNWHPADGDFEDALRVGEPGYVFRHGNEVGLELDTKVKYQGKSSLLVTGRTVPYGGPGWDVKEHLKSEGWGVWYISAWVRAASSEGMQMYFNVYLKSKDGSEDWLTTNTNVSFDNKGWTLINSDGSGKVLPLISSKGKTPDFANLEIATLYMCTGEGQLGDFYIDDVKLYKDSKAPTATTGTTKKDPQPAEYKFFPLDGEFEGALKTGQPGNLFKHGGTANFQITTKEKHSGKSSLLVTGRDLPYSGPGWDVKDFLKQNGWGHWYIDAYVKKLSDEPMTMYFAVYLKFKDGTEDWLSCGNSFSVSNKEWSQINSNFHGGSALLRSSGNITPDFNDLEVATMYMCTGEGQLGDFYIDDVKIWRGSDEVEDDEVPEETNFKFFPLDGTFEDELKIGVPGHLFKHGGIAVLSASSEEAYEGKYSLKVSERDLTYSGAGWDVTGYLRQMGWGDWYFSAYGKTADDALIGISYSIYMQFKDGGEDWLNCGRQTYISSGTWTRINVDAIGNPGQLRPASGSIPNFDNLKYAVLYPNTDEGQLGDYYLDKVELWKEDKTADTSRPTVTRPKTVETRQSATNGAGVPWLIPVIGGTVVLVGVAAAVALFVLKKRKSLTDGSKEQ